MSNRRKRFGAVFFAAILVASALIGAAGTVVADGTDSTVDPHSAPGTQIEIAASDLSWDDPLSFEDNDGDVVTPDVRLNESADNPFHYTFTDFQFADAGKFPHGESANVTNASEWTSTGNITVSDTTTAPGVEGVQFSTDGSRGTGDTETATFSAPSETSDPLKRQMQIAVDVSTLDTGATVQVRAVDGDGDYIYSEINTSRSSGEDLIANATGEGYVFQRQLGELKDDGNLVTAGDGALDGIETIEVVVMDGDFTGSVSAMNFDRTSKWTLGVEKVDVDDDDALEEEAIYEVGAGEQGMISIMSRSSIGFDSGVIHGLRVDVIKDLSEDPQSIPLNDVHTQFNQTDNRPGYFGTATLIVPTGYVSGYDVSWYNLGLNVTQNYLESRYLEVSYAEGVGSSTEPTEVDDSSWTDYTDSFSSQGSEVQIDSTIQPGETSYLKFRLQLQEGEFSFAKNFFSTGGATGKGPGDRGGGLGSLPIIGGIFTLLAGFVAYAKGMIPFVGGA
ncbi:hypothetical protein [Halobaculum sp. EA56]|uniref:hypothetical protein n=1 Tax=Halobaculum sp. EA56 TaxID=3421648 RepID=UPI003EBE8680